MRQGNPGLPAAGIPQGPDNRPAGAADIRLAQADNRPAAAAAAAGNRLRVVVAGAHNHRREEAGAGNRLRAVVAGAGNHYRVVVADSHHREGAVAEEVVDHS